MTSGGRNLYYTSSMELAAIKSPLKSLVDKAVGLATVKMVQSCLVTDPEKAFACEDPLPVHPEKESLESIISKSRYILLHSVAPDEKTLPGVVQQNSFLSGVKPLPPNPQ